LASRQEFVVAVGVDEAAFEFEELEVSADFAADDAESGVVILEHLHCFGFVEAFGEVCC
jgi:hypothetical protein